MGMDEWRVHIEHNAIWLLKRIGEPIELTIGGDSGKINDEFTYLP